VGAARFDVHAVITCPDELGLVGTDLALGIDSGRITEGRVADQTSPMRDLGANVTPRPERRAGSQTHKIRRGLGESRYRGTLGDPGASPGTTLLAACRGLSAASIKSRPQTRNHDCDL
jgi:hypothetical protein